MSQVSNVSREKPVRKSGQKEKLTAILSVEIAIVQFSLKVDCNSMMMDGID